ncbi:MAG: O-antigen ligase family protein [Ilumatobacteraceae bacterium]|nr:O-antigen ligase family protein [Ilumatobacteraceae bacterium]
MHNGANEPATGSADYLRDLLSTPTSWTAKALSFSLLLLPIAYIEPVLLPSWSPRMVVALLVVPLGIYQFVTNLLRWDRPTIWLLGLMTSCTFATLIGDAPLWNLRGGFGRDSSLTFLIVLSAFWALARSLEQDGRRLAVAASLAGAGLSCVAALIQVVAAPTTGILALIGSRPGGLLDNPVSLGAIAAGASSLAATAWARRSVPTLIGSSTVTLFAACVSLSGSRGAFVGLVIGAIASVAIAEQRTKVMLLGSFAFGWTIAGLLTSLTGGRDVAARASLEDGGRSTLWRYSLEAIADKPVFGHGLGQFRSATQTYFEPEFVRLYASHPIRGGWPDAHNVFLQYAVIGGLFAVVFMSLFAWSALRRARGPMMWAALAVALTWLLQPVTLATGPMGFAWLGLAMSPVIAEPQRTVKRQTQLLVLLGAVMSLGLLIVDQQLHRNVNNPAAFTNQIQGLPSDPLLASRAADLNRAVGNTDEAIRWARQRTQLEPFSAVAGATLAEIFLDAGRNEDAVTEIQRSLERDAYNPTALRTALGVALVTGDIELFELASKRLAELGLD